MKHNEKVKIGDIPLGGHFTHPSKGLCVIKHHPSMEPDKVVYIDLAGKRHHLVSTQTIVTYQTVEAEVVPENTIIQQHVIAHEGKV